ncbi:hypothetical protein E3P99_02384 [Wallemia hederae]|uniref:HRDC domain-containing protein n=1 Tax=Wallemia hederae TaxID=1540922 RepID=A0A4T0FMV6_9BASI|nr:hypothetical protein E3P99_02384 [Wallemia hederae]
MDLNLEEKTKNLQKSAINLTKISKNLLKGDDLAFQRSIDGEFSGKCEQLENGVVDSINQLLGFVNSNSRQLDADDLVGDSKAVGEVVDQLLEDSSINIDKHTNAYNKPSLKKDLEPAIYNDKSIQRKPQLKWMDKVDNSNTLWQPLITHKPNAKTPLSLTRSDGVLSHPYKTEIETIQYPPHQLSVNTPIQQGTFEETPFTWIDTEDSFNVLLEKLSKATEIAVDLEHHDFRSYHGFVCLMQISIRGEDFIIDTLELRDQLIRLNDTFTNPAIVKVFHGADSDIVWLQRDFGVYVVNLFDTYHATKVLGFNQHSLASLLVKFCSYTPDKRYQRADWRKRPLTKPMLDYARSDTHYLLFIYDILRNTLIEKSTKKNNMLKDVLDRSAQVALKVHHRDLYDYDTGKGFNGWYNVALKWNKRMDPALIEVFRRLHQWRDELARKEDESVHLILSNHQLFDVAIKQPTTPQKVFDLFQKKPPHYVRVQVKSICQAINSALQFADKHADKLHEAIVPRSMNKPTNVHLPVKTGLDHELWNIPQSQPTTTSNTLSSATRSKLFGQDSSKQAPQASTSKLFSGAAESTARKNTKAVDKITSSFDLVSLIPHASTSQDYSVDAFDEYKRPIQIKPPPMPARVDEVLKEDKQKMAEESKASASMNVDADAELPYKSKAERMAESIPVDAGITADDIATVGKQTDKKRKRKDKKEKSDGDKEKKKDKESKKDKVDIPQFDYDNEESVLDRPLDDLSQSTKKPRKQRVKASFEGQFKRPGSSKTQQTSGNRSHTFTKYPQSSYEFADANVVGLEAVETDSSAESECSERPSGGRANLWELSVVEVVCERSVESNV